MQRVREQGEALRYSVVVPVYNRAGELDELLESLSHQSYKGFNVIVVDDGSSSPCDGVCEKWAEELEIHYICQSNQGPAGARNTGVACADCRGEYVLFFDSDCLIPGNYMLICDELLRENPEVDLFGGPDAWHESFSKVQKAISYAMTSPLSTGGIRGGSERADKFYPRTFNMGVRRVKFLQVHGFRSMRYGEDVDLSIRLIRAGSHSALFPDLFVYHRRRERLGAFFCQVYHSGEARVALGRLHKGSLRVVHALPSVAVVLLGVALTWIYWPATYVILSGALLYSLVVLLHARYKLHGWSLAFKSVVACWAMICGYGLGFLVALFGSEPECKRRRVRGGAGTACE